jgi:S1-C subfamily serine protease
MGWNTDDFDPFGEPDDEDRKTGRFTGLVIGAAIGAVTLILIAALIVTTVGFFFTRKASVTNSVSQSQPAQPSPADLRNANYRPSTWAGPNQVQFVTPTPISTQVVAEADAEHQLLTNIYQRVNPSVVNIEIVSRFQTSTNIIDSSGSGFVLDTEGHIVTNAHVVRDAEEIVVTFFDGYVANAKLVGVDDYSDLGVIEVDPSRATLVPVILGDSNSLQVGQRVIAIGNPFGLNGSMTDGIISALDRSLLSAQLLDPTYKPYNNPSIIQVDAAVNPGNSGGPLLNSYGEVIGITTAIRTENGGFQGIAFAVPVNTVKRIVPQLIANGKAEYSWLGISSPPADQGYSVAAVAEELGLPVRNGVLISAVTPGSPAERAGLQAGTNTQVVRGMEVPTDSDIIVAINGTMIRDIDDLLAYLVENTSPGDKVVLTIVRRGQTLDLDVTLGVRPDN